MSHAIETLLKNLSQTNVFDIESRPGEADLQRLISDSECVIQDALDSIGSICEIYALATADSELDQDRSLNILDAIRLLAALAKQSHFIQDEARGKRRHNKVKAVAATV